MSPTTPLVLALASVGLACAVASHESAGRRTNPALPGPAAASVAAAPSAVPALPESVARAVRVLVDFKGHDAEALAEARRIVGEFEESERYEESGEVDGRPFYYARERYPALGLTLHRDDARITNVEMSQPGG